MVCRERGTSISSGRRVCAVPREFNNVDDIRWHAQLYDDITFLAAHNDMTSTEARNRINDSHAA